MDCVQGCLYTGSPSWQTINGCVCNGLMSTVAGKLIITKLSFQMNHPSICGTMMAAFVLRGHASEHCLPECVMERHSGLTPRLMVWVQFHIMDDPICYELSVISIATDASVKCYSSKSLPSFKASVGLSFSRMMHAHISKTV
ncbi:transposable element Tcb1 transposase [Trichonephila clavipes]|nr:transposable element Tcb1 transposase [Trichonephila clavipes]